MLASLLPLGAAFALIAGARRGRGAWLARPRTAIGVALLSGFGWWFASFVYVTLAQNLAAELDRSVAERAIDVKRALRGHD